MSNISNMSSTGNRNINYIKPIIHLSTIQGQGDILSSAFKCLVTKYKTKTMPSKNSFKTSTTNKNCKNKIIVKLDCFACDSKNPEHCPKGYGVMRSAQWEYYQELCSLKRWKLKASWQISTQKVSLISLDSCRIPHWFISSIYEFSMGEKQILKSKHNFFLLPGTIFRLCCHTTNWQDKLSKASPALCICFLVKLLALALLCLLLTELIFPFESSSFCFLAVLYCAFHF